MKMFSCSSKSNKTEWNNKIIYKIIFLTVLKYFNANYTDDFTIESRIIHSLFICLEQKV